MPYDSSLDENIFSKSWEYEKGRLNVGVWSYNKGEKKIQITRENKDKEEVFRFTKLGRLTKEEAQALLPMIQAALENI